MEPTPVPASTYDRMGDALDVDPILWRAISRLESGERADAIRFERHWWKKKRLLSREAMAFDRHGNPKDWGERWAQFEAMDAVCRTDARINPAADGAAIEAHSFGWMQIMGFNHRFCGFDTPRNFLEAMRTLDGQAGCAIEFVRESPALHAAMKNRHLNGVAVHWNGLYHQRYDEKLGRCIARLTRETAHA